MLTQTASPSDGTIQAGSAAFDALMLAITTCQTPLTVKIDHVQTEMALIRWDMDKFRERVAEVERRVSGTGDIQREYCADLQILKSKVKILEARAGDAENRNRLNNLRVLGLPEGAESSDPMAFMEHLLPSLLPKANFSPHFSIERSHGMPATRGPQGAPPHTFIVKLLHYRDRDTVLRVAHLQGELKFENAKLQIFPDYPVETQRQRKSFDQVCAVLREKGVKYSMLFLAKLQDGDRVQFFTSPRETTAWADTLQY